VVAFFETRDGAPLRDVFLTLFFLLARDVLFFEALGRGMAIEFSGSGKFGISDCGAIAVGWRRLA